MNRAKTLAIFNTLSFLLQVGLSYLTQFKIVNRWNVGEISDRHPSLITPADTTFSIWGIIYTALAVFCLYHIIIAYKHDPRHPANSDISRIGGLFIFNNLAAAAWVIAWTNEELLVSVLLIIIQLLTLAGIHSRLNIFNRDREAASTICTQFPLSIYFGWISVATIANIAIYLVSIGWNRFGVSENAWTIMLLCLVILVGLLIVLFRKNVFYGVVIIWALYGIMLKREEIGDPDKKIIAQTAMVGIALMALVCVIQTLLNFRYKKKVNPFPMAKYSLK